jgi:hypothetical protein
MGFKGYLQSMIFTLIRTNDGLSLSISNHVLENTSNSLTSTGGKNSTVSINSQIYYFNIVSASNDINILGINKLFP